MDGDLANPKGLSLSRRFEANVGIDLLAWTSGSYRRAVVSQFEGYKPRQ